MLLAKDFRVRALLDHLLRFHQANRLAPVLAHAERGVGANVDHDVGSVVGQSRLPLFALPVIVVSDVGHVEDFSAVVSTELGLPLK